MEEDMFTFIKGLVEEELVLMRREGSSGTVEEIQEWERLHIPTLKKQFESEIGASRDGLIEETDCRQCIQNYLLSLNAAILASKGSLKDKK